MTDSKTTHYDCALIGGGLAGLSLAIQLAQARKKVILFEKETYPFHKVCGEYIAMESWNFLESLGVPLAEMSLPRITNLKISSPSGNTIQHKLNPGGFGISRFTLDKMLFDMAVKNGVDVITNCKVEDVTYQNDSFEVKSQKGIITAKVVCGTFGKRSNLDVKWQRAFVQNTTEYVAVKYHVNANLPDDVIELHNFKDGYCGISKVDDGRYCLCYLTSSKNLKDNQGNIAAMQEKVLMKNPYLKKYISNFPSMYEKPLAISQINFAPKTAVENHVLMLGDAAGLITPLCGNGMSMALHAAKLSSSLILNYLSEKITRVQLEEQYKAARKKNFTTRLQAGRIIQAFFGNAFLSNLLISALKPFPGLVSKLIALTHGEEF